MEGMPRFWGRGDKSLIIKGSRCVALLVVWHGKHEPMSCFAIMSMPGNHTFHVTVAWFSQDLGVLHGRYLTYGVEEKQVEQCESLVG